MTIRDVLLTFLALLQFLPAWTLDSKSDAFRIIASNMLPAEAPMYKRYQVSSSLQCALLCRGLFRCRCRSYGYGSSVQGCFLYRNQYSGSTLSDVAQDVDYFEEFQVDENAAVGAACTEDSTCTGCNMACRDGTCQCVIGYHFSPGPGTCVALCPAGYGDGYYEVANWNLNGNDVRSSSRGLSVVECWKYCASDPACRSFEHSATLCHLSHTTKLEHPRDWQASKGASPLSYFQRNCALPTLASAKKTVKTDTPTKTVQPGRRR